MRTLCVLLLLANLGFWAWQRDLLAPLLAGPQAPQALVRSPFQQAPQALVRLEELPAEQQAMMAEIAASRSLITSTENQLAEAREELAEVEQELAGNAPPAPPPAEPEPATVVPWCASAGVFADAASAGAWIESLAALGGSGAIEAREEAISSTWWVYLPAFPSETAAQAMLDELRAANIDSYYMRTGDMAGGISLGVYSLREGALNYQARLAERGYTTSLGEVKRLGERLYVNLQLPDATVLESPQWADFLASSGGVQVAEKACADIAPQNQFP